MKNKDRDEKHRRRREMGDDPSGEDDPDGRAVAEKLYGGPPSGNHPRCDNCGTPLHENADIGCAKCDPRARRAGMAGPVPIAGSD